MDNISKLNNYIMYNYSKNFELSKDLILEHSDFQKVLQEFSLNFAYTDQTLDTDITVFQFNTLIGTHNIYSTKHVFTKFSLKKRNIEKVTLDSN